MNLETDSIEEIYPLGVKSWSDLLMDGSDRDSGMFTCVGEMAHVGVGCWVGADDGGHDMTAEQSF